MRESTAAHFEGTEKKVELVVGEGAPALLDLGDEFWRSICHAAGAEILSRISCDSCVAYLLSESSLFVFRNKMLMLTCGRTSLVDGVLALLETVPAEQIEMLIYQRKNEAFPHEQPSSFHDDASRLNGRLPGRAFRFGHEDEHHLYMFHLARPYESSADDVTVEILMYGLDEGVRREFWQESSESGETIRKTTGIDRILPGFQIDDHRFDPGGYSLNAIRGDEYYTVHVTPEEHASYASFETNHRFGQDPNEMISRVLQIFRPRSYDLVLFDHAASMPVDAGSYRLHSHVVQAIDCGYEVRFMNFSQPCSEVGRATELPRLSRPSQVVTR